MNQRPCLIRFPVQNILIFGLIFIIFNENFHFTFSHDRSDIPKIKYAVIGKNVSILCETTTSIGFVWRKDGINISATDKSFNFSVESGSQANIKYYLTIINVKKSDAGNYSCEQMTSIDADTAPIKQNFEIHTIIPPKVVEHSNVIRLNISQSTTLYCIFEAYPIDDYMNLLKWSKNQNTPDKETKEEYTDILNRSQINKIGNNKLNLTIDLVDVSKKYNGTYTCEANTPYDRQTIQELENEGQAHFDINVLILDKPQISIDFVKAVGAHEIYLNWTVNDGNLPIKNYIVQFQKEGSQTFTYYNTQISGQNRSYTLTNFEPNTEYKIRILATNDIGTSSAYEYPYAVRTLTNDATFVPSGKFTGNTRSSITISWSSPPVEIAELIHYFEVEAFEKNNLTAPVQKDNIDFQTNRNLPSMFDNLKSATHYVFRIRACSRWTGKCGNWSTDIPGETMKKPPGPPQNLRIECIFNNVSGRVFIKTEWNEPAEPNGDIDSYDVELEEKPVWKRPGPFEDFRQTGHTSRRNVNTSKADFPNMFPNSNYTIKVFAKTRQIGDPAIATCITPRSTPDLHPFKWSKEESNSESALITLKFPRISERNGPICGYRIYLYRLPTSNDTFNYPLIENLPIKTYDEVHHPNNTKGGAYIAEIVSWYPRHPTVTLGDKQNLIRFDMPHFKNKQCVKLLNGYIDDSKKIAHEKIPALAIPAIESSNRTQIEAGKLKRRRRHHNFTRNSIESENESGKSTLSSDELNKIDMFPSIYNEESNIRDGPLDENSNYTGFVEIIANIDDESKVASVFSNYFEILDGKPLYPKPAPLPPNDGLTEILQLVTYILCGLIVLVLILLMALCIMHRMTLKKHASQGHDVISLRDSLSRALCGGRGGQNHRHLITANSKPADVGPIHRSELTQAYIQRHRDTDYGFLREYEMLPHRFNDRTTKASDMKENSTKNRYPDIKSYDQTRVKLSERISNGMSSASDYINANFVLGYKERKKFICAQGPMDTTINDFWRMIWEQHLEIIVMLTNLEEYNKAKCAKYWPEEINDVTKFGEITVKFVEEHRFSDYLIRELKITKAIVNHSNGSNNSSSGEEEDERHITQYHYLAWKDFMAPELGIIRFIRHINEVYSVQRGPILVHCSAGVGRTGTLVALDSLMQQLNDENQVSIFNTVYDLRHQRNFLVQSLKQYIFLYRALLEVAKFGNTEIQMKDLNNTVEQLKQKPLDSKEQCKLEIEYEKIQSSLDETNKNCTAGTTEENRPKNRDQDVIPFDRNRVILTPIGPTSATYINATFIESYDHSESFIITQDPLEDTISDFWRMISEQNINTIVMISEIGDGLRKCPRYWADDEIKYEHILVKYMQSESCPYYTRREFNVTNFKMKDTIKVTQFQYNGWPTVEGEVPEVTRGMLELIDQMQLLQESNESDHPSPTVVHCSTGTDRSSIFVTLCILVQQLRLEKKVDICTVVRKLRTQRSQFLNSYSQYEFVHRAIANYADLHKADLDTSPVASVRSSN